MVSAWLTAERSGGNLTLAGSSFQEEGKETSRPWGVCVQAERAGQQAAVGNG